MQGKFNVRTLLCVCLAILVVGGGIFWRQRQFDRQVEQCISSLARGDDGGISEDLLASLARNPRYDRELRLFRAAMLLRAGKTESVFAALAGLRPHGRIREALLFVAGETSYRTGDLAEAERAFQQIVSSTPQNSRAHRWLATIYHDLGNINATFSELEKVAELEPDDFFAFRLMGTINMLDFQKPKEAAECFRKALERNPPTSQLQSVRTELAQSLAVMNDFTGALAILDAAENDAPALALKAECRWGLGERDEADELLRQSIALNPNERGGLLLSARIAIEDGKPQLAVEPLRSLLERDPHDVNTRYQLSTAYQRMGDREAAAAELEKMKASQAMISDLSKLYYAAVQNVRDAHVRDEIAELCEKLDKHDLAQLWRRSAEYCRQNESGALQLQR